MSRTFSPPWCCLIPTTFCDLCTLYSYLKDEENWRQRDWINTASQGKGEIQTQALRLQILYLFGLLAGSNKDAVNI